MNGLIIGKVKDYKEVLEKLYEKRDNKIIPFSVSISYHKY